MIFRTRRQSQKSGQIDPVLATRGLSEGVSVGKVPKMKPLFALIAALALCLRSGAAEKPNFIVIFCDDLGYADIGPFGSKLHRTPHLDRMADEGRVFTDFYVTSGVCTPSRASLMTGCYPRRVGLHQNGQGGWVLFPGNRRGIAASEVIMPEMLKAAGYACHMVGKWHLGDQPQFLPTKNGFDSYFGIPFSNDMGETDRPKKPYPPLPLIRDGEVIEEEPDQRLITKRYTEEALKVIAANKDKPFFLYLPHTMPHWPQYSSSAFAGKSKNGKWGDTVEEIDWSTGEILKALERHGIDDKTLVVFMSDNGGATNHGAKNTPLRGGKGSTWEGGHRVPFVARWPGKVPAGSKTSELATSMDLYTTFAKLAGGAVPGDRVIDGRDVSDLLLGKDGVKSPHEAYYYYFRDDLCAVRSGKWKLHVKLMRGRKGAAPLPYLFDLENDIGEENNVADTNPEVVERLQALLEMAREDLGDADRKGANERPADEVDSPKTLTQKR